MATSPGRRRPRARLTAPNPPCWRCGRGVAPSWGGDGPARARPRAPSRPRPEPGHAHPLGFPAAVPAWQMAGPSLQQQRHIQGQHARCARRSLSKLKRPRRAPAPHRGLCGVTPEAPFDLKGEDGTGCGSGSDPNANGGRLYNKRPGPLSADSAMAALAQAPRTCTGWPPIASADLARADCRTWPLKGGMGGCPLRRLE